MYRVLVRNHHRDDLVGVIPVDISHKLPPALQSKPQQPGDIVPALSERSFMINASNPPLCRERRRKNLYVFFVYINYNINFKKIQVFLLKYNKIFLF